MSRGGQDVSRQRSTVVALRNACAARSCNRAGRPRSRSSREPGSSGGGSTAAAAYEYEYGSTVTICHHTGSTTNPTVSIIGLGQTPCRLTWRTATPSARAPDRELPGPAPVDSGPDEGLGRRGSRGDPPHGGLRRPRIGRAAHSADRRQRAVLEAVGARGEHRPRRRARGRPDQPGGRRPGRRRPLHVKVKRYDDALSPRTAVANVRARDRGRRGRDRRRGDGRRTRRGSARERGRRPDRDRAPGRGAARRPEDAAQRVPDRAHGSRHRVPLRRVPARTRS